MSLNAATIETLIAKGLSAEDILDVARSLEKRRDNTNAERQAGYAICPRLVSEWEGRQ